MRVVELFDVGSNSNWDSHTEIDDHRKLSRQLDQPLAALVKDLKQRGLLDETLIVGCTEFGRSPWQDLTPGAGPTTTTASPASSPAAASAAAPATADPTSTATRSPRTPSTSTTSTPRSCTSWGSTTRGSPTATRAATSA